MRAMSIGGNWGGNVDGFKNIPDAFIQSLLADNVNWVGIKLPIISDSISDPTVKIKYRPTNEVNYSNFYSFDDIDLINAVTKLKQNGIKVYLSLVIMQPSSDQSTTCNTAQYGVDSHLFGDTEVPNIKNSSAWGYECINPLFWWWSPSHPNHAANVAQFWASYTQAAVKYAKMSQQLGVDMFAIGEETERLFRTRSSGRFLNHYKIELMQMVAAVRAEYKGLLTYSQSSFVYLPHPEWWGYETGASSSLFKDLMLDVVGISGYYSLVGSPVNRVYSVSELMSGWTYVFNNYLLPLQADNPGIPVIFTDTGSVDTVDAPHMSLSQSSAPYVFSDLNNNGIDDGREQQANMFQAFLNVNKSFNYLLRGTVFAWSLIDTDPSTAEWYQTHRDIQIHGKPAELVIRNVYADWKNVTQ